jgi:hypothetical protein
MFQMGLRKIKHPIRYHAMALIVIWTKLIVIASQPFIINTKDFQATYDGDCQIKVIINGVTPQGFSVKGDVSIRNGQVVIFCNGAMHIWNGTTAHKYGGYTFQSADTLNPLTFKIVKDTGYVFQCGRGTVKDPSGKITWFNTAKNTPRETNDPQIDKNHSADSIGIALQTCERHTRQTNANTNHFGTNTMSEGLFELVNDGYKVHLGGGYEYNLMVKDTSDFKVKITVFSNISTTVDTLKIPFSSVYLKDKLGKKYDLLGCTPEDGSFPVSHNFMTSAGYGSISVNGKKNPSFTIILSGTKKETEEFLVVFPSQDTVTLSLFFKVGFPTFPVALQTNYGTIAINEPPQSEKSESFSEQPPGISQQDKDQTISRQNTVDDLIFGKSYSFGGQTIIIDSMYKSKSYKGFIPANMSSQNDIVVCSFQDRNTCPSADTKSKPVLRFDDGTTDTLRVSIQDGTKPIWLFSAKPEVTQAIIEFPFGLKLRTAFHSSTEVADVIKENRTEIADNLRKSETTQYRESN